MRVLLSRRRGGMRGHERGAAAVLMSLSITFVFLGLAAFVTDFGLAYTSKRQLQTAVDAAALGAASLYTTLDGDCDELVADGTVKGEAKLEAQQLLVTNHPDATMTDSEWSIGCNEHGQLEVSVTATASTPVGLGALFVDGNTITTSRTADATVAPATSVAQAKPYALCNESIPAPVEGSGVVQVDGPGSGHTGSDCFDAEGPGNWWFIDCPEDSTGDVNTVAHNLEHGCDDPIDVVPGQPDPADADAGELSEALTEDCDDEDDRSSFCLTGDTGNSSLKNQKVYELWPGLVGETLFLPVFCSTPTCDPDTVNGSGNTSTYPVHGIAAVVLCGYHIYDKAADSYAEGECAGNPFDDEDAEGEDDPDAKNKVWLYLKFVHVQVTGGTEDTECGLDESCDQGPRRVLLTR